MFNPKEGHPIVGATAWIDAERNKDWHGKKVVVTSHVSGDRFWVRTLDGNDRTGIASFDLISFTEVKRVQTN